MSDATDLALPRCKTNEGFRSKVYKDSRGFNTVGYGLNLDAGLSEHLASVILAEQLAEAEADAESAFLWYSGTDGVRQSVIVELVFNTGLAKLKGFTHMLAACQAQDWNAAAAELQNSAWFGQVGRRGPLLVRLLTNGG
jgi:lysozyme